MESLVYNQEGKEVGKIKLPDGLFGAKWNVDMVHQVFTSIMMNRRNPVAHAKNRGEVSGGGKKPWRQKGTGRARHGSTRSPIWVGGGTTHGPRNDKNYSRKINTTILASAFKSAISKKLKDGEIICLDALNLKEAKTKEATPILKAISGIKGFEKLANKKENALCIVLPKKNENVKRSFANIGKVSLLETRNLSLTDVLNNKFVAFVEPEESLKILQSRFK